MRISLTVFVIALVSISIWGTWQSGVRIKDVQVNGNQDLLLYAQNALYGAYLGSIPRDSIFFFPKRSIRSNILNDHPEIAAVSISRKGFSSISITAIPRVALGRWCGLGPTVPSADVQFDGEYCYLFDASGYIFAPATESSTTINTFVTYAPLRDEGEEPLRATLSHIDLLPSVFDFARQFSTRIVPVRSVVLEGDEVRFSLSSGARLLYVLGNERTAFSAIISAYETTDFADETIDYIDLRFDGKVYLKRKE